MAQPGRPAARRMAFLSAAAREFLRRRAVEGGGLVLFALAAALGLALASYNPLDPSFNNATLEPASNAAGVVGAYIADILLQTLGLSAAALVLLLAAWGWRVIVHRGLRWWHMVLLPVALLLLAAVLAGGPAGIGRLPAGPGGYLGPKLLGLFAQAVRTTGLRLSSGLLALILLPPAVALLVAALGLRRADWRRLGGWVLAPVKFARAPTSGRARLPEGAQDPRPLATRLLAKLSFLGLPFLGRGRLPEAVKPAARPRREPGLRTRGRAGPEDAPDGVTEEADEEDGMEPPLSPPDDAPRVVRRNPKLQPGRRAAAEQQPALDLLPDDEYQLPPLTLLSAAPQRRVATIDEDALEQNARLLESVLDDFGVRGTIVKVRPGPVVALYELEPAPGTKSSRVIGLSDDIARSMSAVSARVAVIPGRNAIGIELPNARRETVYLRELLASADYENTAARLTLALGKDIAGAPVIADLARMPHLLIAGTTGSGKSVAVNTMILSLLYRLPPDQCKFIMIDPKMLELSVYDGIPQLLAPVVTDPGKAVVALKWTVREMEDRYRKMSEVGVRNIAGYNQRLREAREKGEDLSRTVQTGFDAQTGEPIFEARALDLAELPLIVVIVDEMADLMLVAGKDIEASVQRLAQMARASGIHLIMATQRPSVDVITGTIKANFPTRISFQVTSKIDSRTILGEQGAEQLLGMGDMLYMPGAGRITRVHGPFVSDAEVEKVVAFLKAQGQPAYVEAVTEDLDGGSGPGATGGGEGGDELYDQAVAMVTRERKASTSFIQRHLQIGYNRAARIIEQMEAEGVVGRANHVGKREVLARDIDDREH